MGAERGLYGIECNILVFGHLVSRLEKSAFYVYSSLLLLIFGVNAFFSVHYFCHRSHLFGINLFK